MRNRCKKNFGHKFDYFFAQVLEFSDFFLNFSISCSWEISWLHLCWKEKHFLKLTFSLINSALLRIFHRYKNIFVYLCIRFNIFFSYGFYVNFYFNFFFEFKENVFMYMWTWKILYTLLSAFATKKKYSQLLFGIYTNMIYGITREKSEIFTLQTQREFKKKNKCI